MPTKKQALSSTPKVTPPWSKKFKWEQNRQKASVINSSKRRADFRKVVNEFITDRATTDKPFYETPFERRHHTLENSPVVSYKIVLLNDRRNLILKDKGHVANAMQFARFVSKQKPKSFELVRLKIAQSKVHIKSVDKLPSYSIASVMHYVKRPSLSALITFLKGIPITQEHELAYCDTLVEQSLKSGISSKDVLLKMALLANKEMHIIWGKYKLAERYDYSSANFIVTSITKKGTLKIAIVDV